MWGFLNDSREKGELHVAKNGKGPVVEFSKDRPEGGVSFI